MALIKKTWYTELALKNIKYWGADNPDTREFVSKFMQYQMSMYISLMDSKIMWIRQAEKLDPFNSNNFYWIDGGLPQHLGPELFDGIEPYKPFHIWSQCRMFFQVMWWPNCCLYEPEGELRYVNETIGGGGDEYIMGGYYGMKRGMSTVVDNTMQNLMALFLNRQSILLDESVTTVSTFRYPLLFGDRIMYNTIRMEIKLNEEGFKYHYPLMAEEIHLWYNVSLAGGVSVN